MLKHNALMPEMADNNECNERENKEDKKDWIE